MGISDSFKWITVISFNLDQDAGLCKSYLESHGLMVQLKNEFISRSYPGIGLSTGGIQVMVADRDVIRASTLLQQAGYLEGNVKSEPSFLEMNLAKIAIVLVIIIAIIAMILVALS